MNNSSGTLEKFAGSLSQLIRSEYHIGEEYYRGDVKRGLRNNDGTGVLAGVSKVGSVQGYFIQDGQRVPKPGQLYYRGIELNEIVEAHRKAGTFGYEEVAYLLLFGYLPSQSELASFNEIMNRARKLPDGFTEDMIMRHPSRNIMNKLARSVLVLYSYDDNPDDTSVENMLLQSIKLVGCFPSIVANAYAVKRHYFQGDSLHIHFPVDDLSTAENFLRMIRPDKQYTEEEAHLLDMMLMVHAEHGGGNNSTFTVRVTSSSGTDTYSSIAAGIGSLKGPLHGGANLAVVDQFEHLKENIRDWTSKEEIDSYLIKMLRKEVYDKCGLIYGIGHAVYTISDPRTVLLREMARDLAKEKGREREFAFLELLEERAVETFMNFKGNKVNKRVCANVDFYSGFVYDLIGLPREVFTPLFAMSRIAGWTAHRIEELNFDSKRIIRPAYRNVSGEKEFVPLDQRIK